ncbi:MAG TPA: signal peptidase II [Gemmatimonadaceae bacterium]|nr:signal peptidase II [Gemmatimonadaceae bacterium]
MLLVSGFVVVVDQRSKAIVARRLDVGAHTSRAILGIRLRHVINRRNQWGSPRAIRLMTLLWLFLTTGAVLAVSVLDSIIMSIAIGAVIGGATGNLLDGISRKGITDFVDLRVWPVFNFADTAIVSGAILLVWNTINSSARLY